MLDMSSTLFICPRGTPGLAPIPFEMKDILTAESRICEVAFVTKEKAPELLATFNSVFLTLTRQISAVSMELLAAERAANKRKSIVILDEAPRILKEKKLVKDSNPAGSQDLREAVLNTDDEYLALLDRVDQIAAILELLKGKLKGIEMAYSSVKKILGEGAFDYRDNRTSAPNEIQGEVGLNGMFGNTRY